MSYIEMAVFYRMRFIFCFFLLLGSFHVAVAQNEVPLLLSQLETAENDSIKADSYRQLFDYYQYSNPDSSSFYLDEGTKYFQENNYLRGVALLTMLKGQQESMLGRQEQAKVYYNDALKIYQDISNSNGVAQCNNGLGVIEGKTGNYLSATRYFMTALREFEKINNTRGILNTYLKLGTVNQINNNLDKALEYFNKGLVLALKVGDKRNTAYFYNNIGIAYGRKDMGDTAIAYFERCMALSGSPDMVELKILALLNTGNVYKDKQNYNRSLEYYYEALKLNGEHAPETKARLILNIATVKGLTDHKGALKDLAEAKQIALEIGQKDLRLEITEEMITQHKFLGDYRSAFSLLEEARILQDSLFNTEKATEIANLLSRHELEKSKEKVEELEVSGKRSTEQRNIIIVIAVLLAVVLLTISYTYRRTSRLNVQLTKSEGELQKTNAIKDRIFSIIGHDLRGPIANIPMVIDLYRDPRTSDAERVYMLDLLTENSMASLETLDKLLHWGKSQIKGTAIQQKSFRASQNLQHQVSLIKGIASNKNITIKDDVPPDTTIYADEDHFNFVIRNLLSNAIKFSHKDSEVLIHADRYTERGFTVFSVKDSGVGIETERLPKVFEAFGSSTVGTNNEGGTSIGLMLCKEFVNENGGKIWVESNEGEGATFFFTLKNA
jgi:signal transduction histidine kinase